MPRACHAGRPQYENAVCRYDIPHVAYLRTREYKLLIKTKYRVNPRCFGVKGASRSMTKAPTTRDIFSPTHTCGFIANLYSRHRLNRVCLQIKRHGKMRGSPRQQILVAGTPSSSQNGSMTNFLFPFLHPPPDAAEQPRVARI